MICCPNKDDIISLGPRTVVGTSINETGAALKARYPNISDGVAPPSHAGMFSRARFDCRLSLLNSLHPRRGFPLEDRQECREGLFLDSASTLFFRGSGSESGELPEDNSSPVAASLSSGRIGSLPLFCLTRGTRWPLPRTSSIRSPFRQVCRWLFSYCRWSARLCGSAICLACSSYFSSISWHQRRN